MQTLARPTLVVAAITVVSLSFIWPSSAYSQFITPVGSAETFDIATWNIEWFGSTGSGQGPSDVDQQRENVEKVIRESGIDLWALQEISDTRQFQKLLDSLGTPWAGVLATESGRQRIAFLYNTDVVFLRQTKHILEEFSTSSNQPLNYFAGRPPLQIKFDIALPDTTVELRVITVHMKCCSDFSSYERRVNASIELKRQIEFSILLGEPIAAVFGDFNDELSGSIRNGSPSPYENFLSDPDDYFFATLTLEQRNENSFCWNDLCSSGSTIDHILITDELMPHYVEDSAKSLNEVITAISDPPLYINSTSDHLPVYARFLFPTNTGTESTLESPELLRLRELYPNPTGDHLEFTIETPSTDIVLVEVYDLLGRKLSSESISPASAGFTRARIDTHSLPAGIYFLRASTLSFTSQVKFVRLGR